jgi:regulator-associated protein of mTOR
MQLDYQRDPAEATPGAFTCDGIQFWVNKRNLTSGNPRDPSPADGEDGATAPGNGASSIVISSLDATTPTWRLRSRLKTFAAALVLCLNLGVDPPDVVKTTPCARLECWVDPAPLPPNKALEGIGRNLQQQYETLSPKVRYKQHLDPSVEETKKFCVNLRRSAKDERVLMHYNGHGVPKPTTSGEIWVFNKSE